MKELVRQGVEVFAVMPQGGSLVQQCKDNGVVVIPGSVEFPTMSPWKWHSAKSFLIDVVDEVGPDIIHSHFVGTTLTMRLALGSRGPVRVFQVPGPLHLEHRLFERGEVATAKPNDFWIGSCHWTCAKYQELGISADKVGLSYYGTDVENFSRQNSIGTLRSELGLSKETPLIGMVSHIYPPKRYLGQTRGLKGHEDLFDAVEAVSTRRPDLKCAVVGGPWAGARGYEERLHEYARKRCGGRVAFLGNRTPVADLYVDMDAAIHPSLSENVGGAVESLLLEVPTISTDVGGFPDLVIPGSTGWLVPPRNPRALARAILEALEFRDQAAKLATQGRKLAVELFDVRTTARQVKNAYRGILETGRVPRELQVVLSGRAC